jgi:hypothetical protein
MPLNYNLERIANYEDVCWLTTPDGVTHKPMNPKTEALIFITIAIGLPEIRTDNVDEFAIRCAMWEKVAGPMCRDGKGDPWPITRGDVEAHVGLSTTASSLTLARFNGHIARVLRDEVTDGVRRAKAVRA